MDMNGVLQAVYDQPAAELSTTTVVGTAGWVAHGHDANGVFDSVYDPATMTIRVVYV